MKWESSAIFYLWNNRIMPVPLRWELHTVSKYTAICKLSLPYGIQQFSIIGEMAVNLSRCVFQLSHQPSRIIDWLKSFLLEHLKCKRSGKWIMLSHLTMDCAISLKWSYLATAAELRITYAQKIQRNMFINYYDFNASTLEHATDLHYWKWIVVY